MEGATSQSADLDADWMGDTISRHAQKRMSDPQPSMSFGFSIAYLKMCHNKDTLGLLIPNLVELPNIFAAAHEGNLNTQTIVTRV